MIALSPPDSDFFNFSIFVLSMDQEFRLALADHACNIVRQNHTIVKTPNPCIGSDMATSYCECNLTCFEIIPVLIFVVL